MIPPTHPRYHSLITREKLVRGFVEGYVVPHGLIAHGRGECFDYLLGEVTTEEARRAIRAAAAALLVARHPVISVNGNTAALVPRDVVELSRVTGARIEVNLFHRSLERERLIERVLIENGASEVLGVGDDASCTIPELLSERRRVSCKGIFISDVVLVPLEDGDRTEALRRMGKFVIAIDLNPLSRTSLSANITIVDNVVRAMPLLVKEAGELKNKPREELESIVRDFSNEENIRLTLKRIISRLESLAHLT